ncbi:MAG: signal peptidase II [Candidatus Peregrinibacteria bacterium]
MYYRSVIGIGLVWFSLDWMTKQWATNNLFQQITLVNDWFYLALHHNQGIAFGIPLSSLLQIIISVILISFLTYWFFITEKKSFLNQAVFGIILGGALGNLMDRLLHRYVVDFIVLKPFPVFNLADLGITVGLLFLALMSFRAP